MQEGPVQPECPPRRQRPPGVVEMPHRHGLGCTASLPPEPVSDGAPPEAASPRQDDNGLAAPKGRLAPGPRMLALNGPQLQFF